MMRYVSDIETKAFFSEHIKRKYKVGWIGRLGLTYIHYWYYVWNR